MVDDAKDLESTLLPGDSNGTAAAEEEEDPNSHFTGHVRLNHSVTALAATIIGAGIVALPRAFATLGLVAGGGLMCLVLGLAYFSLDALIRSAHAADKWTYDSLAESQYGRPGLVSLDWAIVANNSGSMIIYLIIIGDVLVGVPPHYSGLVTNLFGIHSGDVFWVSRPFVVRLMHHCLSCTCYKKHCFDTFNALQMAVICVVFLAPLVSMRNLKKLGPMSSAAVAVAGCLVAAILGLAVTAAFQGQLGDFHWLPNKDMLGATPTRMVINVLAILPVITMSFVCHYNLLPVVRNLCTYHV